MYHFILSLLIILLSSAVTVSADEVSKVVAKVNGSPIMLEDVEREIDRLIPKSAFHRNVSPEKRDKFRKDATERVIDTELMFQEATAQGIKAEKKEIKERIEEIKKRFPSDKQFKEALKRNKTSMKDLESKVEKGILIDKVLKKEVEDRIAVPEEEIKKHYEDNIQRYRELEQVRIRRIIVKFDKDKVTGDREQGAEKKQGARTKDEAKARAEELLARIKKGEEFAAVAYEGSEDPYRVKGGDLEYIHKGRLIPELENIAFEMNNGEVRGPVEVEDGFHIIKLEDKKPEKQLSFDEAKDRIKKELEDRKREDRIKEWFNAMRGKAKIEYVKD